MKLKPLVLAVSLACGPATALAAETLSTEEKRGITSGFIVGAAVGGVPGAAVGVILGGELFGKFVATRRVNRELTAELASVRETHKKEQTQFNQSIEALNRDLDKLIALRAATPKSQMLPVQFRTGSSDIEDHYESVLDQVARLLNRNRDASVTLTGYADRRGEADYNQALSEQRALSIRRYLIDHGAHKSQVLTTGHGETQPLAKQESLESNFFDRRVMVELSFDLDPQLATR